MGCYIQIIYTIIGGILSILSHFKAQILERNMQRAYKDAQQVELGTPRFRKMCLFTKHDLHISYIQIYTVHTNTVCIYIYIIVRYHIYVYNYIYI